MSLFAPLLNYIWTTTRDLGLDADALLASAGIDPSMRRDHSARISSGQFDQLIYSVSLHTADESFVFDLARHIHPSNLGALGYAWMTGATLRQGINRVNRHAKAVYQEFRIDLHDREDELHVEVIFEESEIRQPPLRETARLALLIQLCRLTYGPAFSPRRIDFQRRASTAMAHYNDFFDCAMAFEKDHTMIVIANAVADEELPGFDPALVISFDKQLAELAEEYSHEEIASRVRATILRGLRGADATLERAAEKLNMSHRTLARRLAEKGTSYSTLLNEVKQELAIRYLHDKRLPLTEIAFLLGFSGPSTFSRAFKSWTGETPGRYRQALFQA